MLHSKLWFALVSGGNTSQMAFFYFERWLLLRGIAYSIMIRKCFQVLYLLFSECSAVTGLYICLDSPGKHTVSHTCLNNVVLSSPYC
jgi:hypothetical protein